MPNLFGLTLARQDLLRHVGSLRQVAGVERFTYTDGPAAGVEAVRVWTGGGLDYTVLPGRGLDIAEASYQGIPLAWLSPTGPAHPAFHEARGLGWLRSFHGGLLTGCGLTQAGPPGEDQGEELGLHGRLSNTPAAEVAAGGDWADGDYVLSVSGLVREARVFGENLVLRRRIVSTLGGRSIRIQDEVRNESWRPCPLMMLYHVNLGFPLLAEGSEVVIPARETRPRDEEAAKGLGAWATIPRPAPGLKEQVFLHTPAGDATGRTFAALLNTRLGLGVKVSFDLADLPHLIQWKMPGEGEYVLGLEPADCLLSGRAGEREAGRLRILGPGEAARHRLTIEVLAAGELDEVRAEARRLLEDRD